MLNEILNSWPIHIPHCTYIRSCSSAFTSFTKKWRRHTVLLTQNFRFKIQPQIIRMRLHAPPHTASVSLSRKSSASSLLPPAASCAPSTPALPPIPPRSPRNRPQCRPPHVQRYIFDQY